MQTQVETEHVGIRTNIITTDRPDSAQLVDLHVYIIPKSIWKDNQNLATNEAMEQAVSAGFVHVPQNLTIRDLRQHIMNICAQDMDFPKEFIYLRSVGRCLTRVKPQQEEELRVKNYRPPMTFAPEIYVLEGPHTEEMFPTGTNSDAAEESPLIRSLAGSPQIMTHRSESWTKPNAEESAASPTSFRTFSQSNERKASAALAGPITASYSNISSASSSLSPRELTKLREEQERLRLRQLDLARQRREMEYEKQKREAEREQQNKEAEREEKQREIERERQRHEQELREQQEREARQQRAKEDVAATRIQATYRGYRQRRKLNEEKQRNGVENVDYLNHRISNFIKYRELSSTKLDEQQTRSSIAHKNIPSTSLEKYRLCQNEVQRSTPSSVYSEDSCANIVHVGQSFGFSPFRHAANEIERLQKEARELARRKAEEEHAEQLEAYDIVKLATRLQESKIKRSDLEAKREEIIRRIQKLHAQASVRREEERDMWKQKYLLEKKKTLALEQRTMLISDNQGDINGQVEQARIRLNNNTKLRQQIEDESLRLKQEIQQLRSILNTLGKQSLPKQSLPTQQPQTIPLSLDITLQY